MAEDELPGIEKPSVLDLAAVIFGEKVERVLVIGLSPRGIQVVADGQLYNSDLPGMLDLARKVLEKQMMDRLYRKRPAKETP